VPKPDLRITRVPMPDWVLRPITTAGPDELGGQLEWHFATPWLFRALASPETYESVLAATGPQDPHEQRRAYWTGALYLMLYRLGWADPARGLAWWASAGYPDDYDDLTLRLMKKVWVNDGRIELLRTWLDLQQRPFLTEFAELCGYAHAPGRDSPPAAAAVPANVAALYGDPLGPAHLHLEPAGQHIQGPFYGGGESARPPLFLRADERQRRAVLVVDSMMGWYGALMSYGKTLPDLGDRSWHVDVFVTSVGHLGRYRRSRTSGIWFTGQHSVHLAGT